MPSVIPCSAHSLRKTNFPFNRYPAIKRQKGHTIAAEGRQPPKKGKHPPQGTPPPGDPDGPQRQPATHAAAQEAQQEQRPQGKHNPQGTTRQHPENRPANPKDRTTQGSHRPTYNQHQPRTAKAKTPSAATATNTHAASQSRPNPAPEGQQSTPPTPRSPQATANQRSQNQASSKTSPRGKPGRPVPTHTQQRSDRHYTGGFLPSAVVRPVGRSNHCLTLRGAPRSLLDCFAEERGSGKKPRPV